MLPAAVNGPGVNFGFPDPCLTPVVLVVLPYPNLGFHALATPVPNVLFGMRPALNLGSIIATTTGDEGGALQPPTLEGNFVVGNEVVTLDMLPAITLADPAEGNAGNCVACAVLEAGAPNVLFTLAPADAAAQGRVLGPWDAFERRLDAPPLADDGRIVHDGVGYLAVHVFSWRLPAVFDAAVSRLLAAGMRALVVDLRGCPGGELSAFVDLAGDFLDRGAEIVTEIDADGDRICHRAQRGAVHRFPLALLVDGGTASAAELFAACLAAHGRAVVVGAPTYGKDTGQVVTRTASGSAVATTVARLLPPGRDERAYRRVLPDVEAGGDALAAAVQHLAGPRSAEHDGAYACRT